MKGPLQSAFGFSLIEVVVAIAIISFAIVVMAALLPMGLHSNQVSTQETHASYILTAVESDLRNSYSDNGKSLLYSLPTPYVADASGVLVSNGNLPPINTLVENSSSIGLDNDERKVSLTGPTTQYQVSIIYTRLPVVGSFSPSEARLIVNWPSLNTTDPDQLTSPSRVAGFVEAYVTFPSP